MTSLEVLAPAKVNLGLEVIGRRADGYHDIATVMQTVSVFDRVRVLPDRRLTFHVSDPNLAGDDNLALVAARELRDLAGDDVGASISLTKRIPVAAGLGGASSDAAATLAALIRLWVIETSPERLRHVALRLGSDVPFLLTGGTALATGRGEALTPIRPLTGVWFVLVIPPLVIPRKTATLYARLGPGDFSSGSRVHRLAADLGAGGVIDPSQLGNAFLHPLRALYPELHTVERAMREAGAPFVALSGAGPTHYTAVPGLARAEAIARSLHTRVDPQTRVLLCRPVSRAPLFHLVDG
jgi:4-diphosphocytidyl-2-C-methyl-D-erythritol kinase